ncbi:MAG: TonB-dependent receptor [Pseudomonadota bacterium]
MTKATAIHIAVLMLCSGAAIAQTSAPAAPAANGDETIQKVVIVSTGSRGSQRTVVDAPVPVDILSAREIGKSGQYSLDKALGFRIPSFNSVQTPVNDASSMLDPYEIRNMGPSRALILINGKRKNSSALVYAQQSPGRGESGADIGAIPTDAIKRIEILRDGASAQYGSDAIAGVVNIILKDSPNEGAFTYRTGITSHSDGRMNAITLNNGFSLMDRGFVNFTAEMSRVGEAQRSGKMSAAGEADMWGLPLAQVQSFLNKMPDGGNRNSSPETHARKFLVNAGLDLAEGQRAYGNFEIVQKKVYSYGNYRNPFWRETDFGLLHPAGTEYMGFQPTLKGKLLDYSGTFGIKTANMGGWTTDFSITTGGNEQDYHVGHTINVTLGADSPTEFDAGGVVFQHTVMNADASKQITDKLNFYMGTELRWELFQTIAGDPASYEGRGAESYYGNTATDSFTSDRHNYGVYFGSSYDISDRWMVDATGRFEKYSDFGNANVWKLASRFKLNDKVTLRGSVSTGFRAPSLHQIYTQKAQYSFVPGQGVLVSGIVSNTSAAARKLDVAALKPEKSDNITLGLGVTPNKDTSMTLDYYNIRMKDRVVLGNEIVPSSDPAAADLNAVMAELGITSVAFFTNAIDTKTSGIDVVYSRKNLDLAGGKLAVNVSGNYTIENKRVGDVRNQPKIAAAHQTVLTETQEALMLTSRPKYKAILGFDLDYAKVNYSLTNTMFGPTTFHQLGIDANLDTKFKTKTLTDFAVNFKMSEKVTLTFNVNNMFNITPKWDFKAKNAAGTALLTDPSLSPNGQTRREQQSDLLTFNGRYPQVTYDGSHFSQLGRIYNAAVNVKF